MAARAGSWRGVSVCETRKGASRSCGARCRTSPSGRNAEQALSTLGRRLIESQEAERVRVARELHDDVGQRLALLSVALDRHFKSGIGSYDDLRKQLAGVQHVIESLSHELHATPLRHLSLARAVRGYCAEVASLHDVHVSVHEIGEVDGLGPDVSLCLFRVVQEALRNAVRHSGAREFSVKLSGDADAVSLEVRDGGVGFDYASAVASSGLGVVSMQERLKLVHGELTIDTRVGTARGSTRACRGLPPTSGLSARPDRLRPAETELAPRSGPLPGTITF
jgi:signal transduction histidine kinase